MRKWRRRIVPWLAVVIGVWAIICLAVPYGVMQSRRHQIISAMQSAETIRIEEFREEDDKVIARHELDAAQRAALIRVLPTILPNGLGISLKLCFVPHHRINARAADGTEFVVTICFWCDEAMHTGSWIYSMQPSGSEALRKFFETNGVRVQSLEEYANMPAA